MNYDSYRYDKYDFDVRLLREIEEAIARGESFFSFIDGLVNTNLGMEDGETKPDRYFWNKVIDEGLSYRPDWSLGDTMRVLDRTTTARGL